MEVLGRLPRGMCPPIDDLEARGTELARWRAGCIITEAGRLVRVERRWLGYRASRLRVWWERERRPSGPAQCELYFHQPLGRSGFLVLGYVRSHPAASLATFYCATLALDEIARLKRADAIVAEVSNARLSDRLLLRWGWQRHCHRWRGRHYIKRFYGNFPAVPQAWRERLLGQAAGSSTKEVSGRQPYRPS